MKRITHDGDGFSFVSLMLGLLLATGCSGGGVSTQVSGQILLDGQPLSGAQVQLLPKGSDVPGMHSGSTDDQGQFTILEDGSSNNPIQPGVYVVLVSKMGLKGDFAKSPGGGMDATYEVVPPLYRDRASTPLTIDVQSATTIAPPFDLKSTPSTTDGGAANP